MRTYILNNNIIIELKSYLKADYVYFLTGERLRIGHLLEINEIINNDQYLAEISNNLNVSTVKTITGLLSKEIYYCQDDNPDHSNGSIFVIIY